MTTVAEENAVLFSPIQLGPVEVKNRLVMASTTSCLGDHTGAATERDAAYLGRRARGGVGMIVTGALHVHPTSNIGYNNLAIHDDRFIEPLSKVAKSVQRHGAVLIGQVCHIGRQWESVYSREALWAPSARSSFPVFLEQAHEMDLDEIQQLVRAFGDAARRVREAGLDGIEIHAAHGFLLQQFISPLANFRTDRYGGSMENRMRFLVEVMEAIRKEAGDKMIVGLKFSATENVEGGLTLEDGLEMVRRLEALGGLDYYLVSAGGFDSIESIHPTSHSELTPFIQNAAAVKRITERPVIAIGKIKTEAGTVILEGMADMVAMARPLICDPELPVKLREERLEDIRSCLSCNECHARIWLNRTIGCAYNPEAGLEVEPEIGPAPTRKRVVVIGGGPAGCEAARVAALRGHDVVLLEKSESLGGRAALAAMLPGREDFAAILMYYATQLDKLGVDVRLGNEADAAAVLALEPEVAVVATGTRPVRPQLPGFDLPHVHDLDRVVAEEPDLGDFAVVYDEDYHVAGLGAGQLAATLARKVALVTPHHNLGPEVEINTQTIIQRALVQLGVQVHLNSRILEIHPGEVLVANRYGGDPFTLEGVSSVVVCNHGQPVNELRAELKGKVAEVALVGDAFSPRRILAAVRDGYTAMRGV